MRERLDSTNPNRREVLAVDFFWFVLLFLEIFISPFLAFLFGNWLTSVTTQGWFVISVAFTFFLWFFALILLIRIRGLDGPKFVSFESFGWLVLIIGEIIVWSGIISDSVQQPLHQGISVLYSSFASSSEMFRVFIIGVVVLFISKMYATHVRMVEATQAVSAELEQMKKELPGISQTLLDSRRALSAGINLILTDIDTKGQSIGRFINDAVNEDRKHDGKLAEQLEGFVKELRGYVDDAYLRLRHSEDALLNDFDLHTYLAMFGKYLELERNILKRSEAYAYEYRSWFVFYALVVRAIVEAIPCHWRKCEFYTILPKKPSQFFNILDSGVTTDWEVGFLEDFCRKFIQENNIDYYRYFLMCDDTFEDNLKIIPKRQDFMNELGWNILVKKANGNVDRALTVDDVNDLRLNMSSISVDDALHLWALQWPPDAREREHGKRYIIITEGDLDTLRGGGIDKDYFFATIRDTMLVYHKTPQHCRRRILKKDEFLKFFPLPKPMDIPIPRDLFAVKEKNGDWLYCIGAFQETATSDSMTVRVYKPGCNSWNVIQGALEELFIDVDGDRCFLLQ